MFYFSFIFPLSFLFFRNFSLYIPPPPMASANSPQEGVQYFQYIDPWSSVNVCKVRKAQATQTALILNQEKGAGFLPPPPPSRTCTLYSGQFSLVGRFELISLPFPLTRHYPPPRVPIAGNNPPTMCAGAGRAEGSTRWGIKEG
jgi:hypothetical protein